MPREYYEIPTSREEEIKDMIRKGASGTEIRRFYSVSPSTLTQYRKELREAGEDIRGAGRPKKYEVDYSKIADIKFDYYETRLTINQIIDKYELGNHQVFYALKDEQGWESRKSSSTADVKVANAVYEYEHNPSKTVMEICKEAGVAVATLYRALDEEGIPLRRDKTSEDNEDWKE